MLEDLIAKENETIIQYYRFYTNSINVLQRIHFATVQPVFVAHHVIEILDKTDVSQLQRVRNINNARDFSTRALDNDDKS